MLDEDVSEAEICKYFNWDTGRCMAQGDLQPGCLAPGNPTCQFRDNPKFDTMTLLIKRVEKLETNMERIVKWLDSQTS